jgi:hypothetical protein
MQIQPNGSQAAESVSSHVVFPLDGGGMNHSLIRKHLVGSVPIWMRVARAQRTRKWLVPIAVLLVILLVRQGYGWPFILGGHVRQIESGVNYDPNLSDSFFETEWVCPNFKDECDEKSRLKATAKCFSSIDGEHAIHSCDAAVLDDGMIDICIHGDGPMGAETLLLVVKNGVFSGQYRSFSKVHPERRCRLWITKKQELTLDKEVYHKGDVIKGRIYFECVDAEANPELDAKFGLWPHPITVKGVFKTIVKSSLWSGMGRNDR